MSEPVFDRSSLKAIGEILALGEQLGFGITFVPDEQGWEIGYMRGMGGGALVAGYDLGDTARAVWGLVGDDLVYLDRSEQPAPENWRFKLSATGIEAAVGQAAEPSDPEGYLRHLDRQVPALDPAARVYVAESVHAFAARCYLSSSGERGWPPQDTPTRTCPFGCR